MPQIPGHDQRKKHPPAHDEPEMTGAVFRLALLRSAPVPGRSNARLGGTMGTFQPSPGSGPCCARDGHAPAALYPVCHWGRGQPAPGRPEVLGNRAFIFPPFLCFLSLCNCYGRRNSLIEQRKAKLGALGPRVLTRSGTGYPRRKVRRGARQLRRGPRGGRRRPHHRASRHGQEHVH